MKRELSEFLQTLSRMVKAILHGKHFWYFPKPILVKAHPNLRQLTEGGKEL